MPNLAKILENPMLIFGDPLETHDGDGDGLSAAKHEWPGDCPRATNYCPRATKDIPRGTNYCLRDAIYGPGGTMAHRPRHAMGRLVFPRL